MNVATVWKNNHLYLRIALAFLVIVLILLLELPLITSQLQLVGWLLIAATVAAGSWLVWSRGSFALILVLLCWLPLQNAVVALLFDSGVTTSLSSGLLILLKELAIIGLLGIALVSGRFRKWLWVDIWLALFVAWVVLHLPFGDLPTSTKVAGVRMLVIPVILYFLGRFTSIPTNGLRQFWTILLVATVAVVILGALEYTIVPNELLGKWQLAMQLAKGQTVGTETNLANLLGGLFFTALVSPLDGSLVWVRRMTSSYLEPLALGYSLVLPLVFIFYCFVSARPTLLRPRWLSALLLIVFGLAQALAMSRGAILATLIGVGIIIFADRHIRARAIVLVLLALMIAMIVPPARTLIVNTIGVEDPSSRGHLAEMEKGWQLLLEEPWGLGLGQGGYVGFQYANADAAGAGESYYFSLSSQVGVIGLALFSIGLLALTWRIWRSYRSANSQWLKVSSLVTMAALAGYCFAAVTSETALGFLTSGAVWLMAGMVTQLGSVESSLPKGESIPKRRASTTQHKLPHSSSSTANTTTLYS